MTYERRAIRGRGLILALLVCAAGVISSCSTVSTFLSNLDADSFNSEPGIADTKIPLPPMAEDFGSAESQAIVPLDGDR